MQMPDLFGNEAPAVTHKGAHKKQPKKAIAEQPIDPAVVPNAVIQHAGINAAPAPLGSISGLVKVGDDCVYRSLYSGYFKAKVLAVRSMLGCVDIDTFGDNGTRLTHLTRIVFRDGFANAQPGEAYIGDRPKQ